MKKIISISIIFTLIGFIPVIHQELTGCSTFGYDHLVSPAVITSADSCITSLLAISLTPSVQLSRLIFFDSAYVHYFFLGVVSILIYSLIGFIIIKIKKTTSEEL